jgi:hypothetical protein
MKNWKSKLFGDNSMNFYSWIVAGLMIVGGFAYYVKRALDVDEYLSSEEALLLAIGLALLGIFGVVWHNYIARVAEKLDAPKKDKIDDHTG